jgi:hypothetical protein
MIHPIVPLAPPLTPQLGRDTEEPAASSDLPEAPVNTLWYLSSDILGKEEAIGSRLVQSFFNSLHERLSGPATFAFVNRAVFLSLDDSPVLEALRDLENSGCRFLSCGTCLDYYDVRERMAVGEVGSMALLQELMVTSDKVVTL